MQSALEETLRNGVATTERAVTTTLEDGGSLWQRPV